MKFNRSSVQYEVTAYGGLGGSNGKHLSPWPAMGLGSGLASDTNSLVQSGCHGRISLEAQNSTRG